MVTAFSPSNMAQSTSTLFSAYASFAGSMMLVRSMARDLIPSQLQSYIFSAIRYLFGPLSSNITLVADEFTGHIRNQVYDAAEIYLSAAIVSPLTQRLRVRKSPRESSISAAIDNGEVVSDVFEGVKLKWQFSCTALQGKQYSGPEKRCFQLTFNKKFKDKIMGSYLPYVMSKANTIKQEHKVIKIYSRNCFNRYEDGAVSGSRVMWGSVNLEHPSTFDKIAMDPEVKRMLMDDLDMFLRRREFYKNVGKAWKRGYLLYGPPGTGKSSLVAAMANYLKFDVYDLELASIINNCDLRRILLSTTNRSILVIEDIDCSIDMEDRESTTVKRKSTSKLTLSGLLNFIDGLWSSCGDERIIVFTTNHKDRIDPALLRPGRMDVHINMSYCRAVGFHILASNYLGIRPNSHPLSEEIEGMIERTDVTPAEVAEELMKTEDVDAALGGLVHFIEKKRKACETKNVEDGSRKDKEGKRMKSCES